MPNLLNYWYTLRHLRPVQVYGRVRLHLSRPRVDARPAPRLRVPSGKPWVAPARRNASLVGPELFRFLNEEHALPSRGWDDPALEKLWLYNLHYFDDLSAYQAVERREWQRALMLRWVRDNPPARGSGWEPYPTSLRMVNWIKWALSGNVLPPECIQSLAVQVRWLSQRLELHLLGNHLFANAKALVFAGLFFEGPEATVWLENGLRILAREVPEQILPDGGQFERSTMYHALALEDVEDLCNVTAAFSTTIPARWEALVAELSARIDAMRAWLGAMSHPDGEIAFFNDAAMGIAPNGFELEQYANRLGFSQLPVRLQAITRLAASGYIRLQRGDGVAILDVAPIGPDYLPAHAHADTLSFELSLFGQRVFVNSGTSRYGSSAERLRQRGTRAHNTIVVDGQDSSEVWGGFRVARRARPVGLTVGCNGGLRVRCAHDGYRHLPGAPQHSREWLLTDGMLVVEDSISGFFERAEARFYLHPGVKLDASGIKRGDRVAILVLPQGQTVQLAVEDGTLRVEPSSWHPGFGLSEPNLCLAVDFDQAVIRTRVQWSSVA